MAVCDPREERREEATRRLGVDCYASLDDLLNASDCEAVVVLTPHDTHRTIVARATASGRHVFCEKAMAVTAEDCVTMIAAARRASVHLLVGHMQKLFPSRTHAEAIPPAREAPRNRSQRPIRQAGSSQRLRLPLVPSLSWVVENTPVMRRARVLDGGTRSRHDAGGGR